MTMFLYECNVCEIEFEWSCELDMVIDFVLVYVIWWWCSLNLNLNDEGDIVLFLDGELENMVLLVLDDDVNVHVIKMEKVFDGNVVVYAWTWLWKFELDFCMTEDDEVQFWRIMMIMIKVLN